MKYTNAEFQMVVLNVIPVSSAKKKNNILITKLFFVNNLTDEVENTYMHVVRKEFSSTISMLEIYQQKI